MLRPTALPQHSFVSLQQSPFTFAPHGAFSPPFGGRSDATMDSSDSFRSIALPFVFSLIAAASHDFNSDLRVIFPHHGLRKVSRGHTSNFPFMPTLITTRILSAPLARLRAETALWRAGTLPLRRAEPNVS